MRFTFFKIAEVSIPEAKYAFIYQKPFDHKHDSDFLWSILLKADSNWHICNEP